MKKNELPKEINEYMDEYIKTHTIKNMDDMQEMMRNLFGPSITENVRCRNGNKIRIFET